MVVRRIGDIYRSVGERRRREKKPERTEDVRNKVSDDKSEHKSDIMEIRAAVVAEGDRRRKTMKITRFDRKVKPLGEGVSGYVELYKTRGSGGFYVVKTYHNREEHESREEYIRRVKHEWEIVQLLEHKNVIEMYKWDGARVGANPRIFMEYLNMDVWRLVNGNSKVVMGVKPSLSIWHQVCCGVAYLHGKDVCHRDLKLDNLVFDSATGVVKIIDFATALAHAPADGALGLVGSKSYAAPETFSQISYDGKKCDIWSIGIILYYLLNHRFPWKIAHLSDANFASFAAATPIESEHSETDRTEDTDIKTDSPLLQLSVFLSCFPSASVEIVESIFQVSSPHRASVSDILASEWYDSLREYDSGTLADYISSQSITSV